MPCSSLKSLTADVPVRSITSSVPAPALNIEIRSAPSPSLKTKRSSPRLPFRKSLPASPLRPLDACDTHTFQEGSPASISLAFPVQPNAFFRSMQPSTTISQRAYISSQPPNTETVVIKHSRHGVLRNEIEFVTKAPHWVNLTAPATLTRLARVRDQI